LAKHCLLLRLSQFRFIGLFRFEAGRANAVVHVDRENPDVLTAREVPDTVTYRCYVRDSRGAFTTANAMLDPRLDNHAAREAGAIQASTDRSLQDADPSHFRAAIRSRQRGDRPVAPSMAVPSNQTG
jgi:hypothetical protein